MSYSITNLKTDLEGVLHGTTTNQIQNLRGVINRAARQLLLDIDCQETKRTVEFVNPIFNTVYDYPIASDVKGNKIIDIFPQVQRLPRDIWSQAYNQAFDVAKQNIWTLQNMFTMNFNSGLKTIKINAPLLNASNIINQADNLTSNGTWTAGGTASNLSVNNTSWAQGAGALQFDITTGIGWVVNSTMQAVDLTTHLNQSSLFEWVKIPVGTDLTSVELRWGSDASNYWTKTVTQNQQGTAFVNGFNLAENVWSSATKVGTQDVTKINYLRVALTVTANMAGCLVNGINSILGTVMSYSYYSKFLFRNASTGAFQETVLDDSDLINLDTESYNLLTNLVAILALQQQQGLDATFFDGSFFATQYQQGLQRYRMQYRSEIQKPQSFFYRMAKQSYRKYLGRNW